MSGLLVSNETGHCGPRLRSAFGRPTACNRVRRPVARALNQVQRPKDAAIAAARGPILDINEPSTAPPTASQIVNALWDAADVADGLLYEETSGRAERLKGTAFLPSLYESVVLREAARAANYQGHLPSIAYLAAEAKRRVYIPGDLHDAWDFAPLADQIAEICRRIAPPIAECSLIGASLVSGDEHELDAAALAEVESWKDYYRELSLPAVGTACGGTPPLVNPEPWLVRERLDITYVRRRLRRESRRAQAWYDCTLRLAGPRSRAVSSFTLGAYRGCQLRSTAWAANQGVQFDGGEVVPLTEIRRRAQVSRRASIYAIVRAMEFAGSDSGYTAFFLTLTLPGEYHPYHSGPRASDGSYPNARPNGSWKPENGPRRQWRDLSSIWTKLRARIGKIPALRKYFGVTVPEPHQDGTPHLHAMLWLPAAYLDRQGRWRKTAYLLRDAMRNLAGLQSRLGIIRKRRDQITSDGSMRVFSTPSSYIMKYLLKSVDDECDEEAERHRAWASSRGIRRMRMVGVHGSLRIWQRIWTSSDEEKLIPRADRARAAMRASERAGKVAMMAAECSAERVAARLAQSAAAADALRVIGGLPGADGKLTLAYELRETQHGRPVRRAVAIVEAPLGLRTTVDVDDFDTGQVVPLRRQGSEVITLASNKVFPVTVVASSSSSSRGRVVYPKSKFGGISSVSPLIPLGKHRPLRQQLPATRLKHLGMPRAPPSGEQTSLRHLHH
jgi:hypothetical protein